MCLTCPHTLLPPCSGPIVVASAVDPTSGDAIVTSPPTGGPWDKYKLTVCEKANNSTCLVVPDCLATAASCPIPGCTPATTYTVVVVAQRTGSPDSSPSNRADFTTPIP